MQSLQSKLFYHLLKIINKKRFLEMQFAFGRFDFYNSKEPPLEIQKVCNVSKSIIKGRSVFTLTPKKNPSQVHILYLHGGAYVQNFVKQHWRFLSMLVEHTHCTITAPDYPLAPTYNCTHAFEMLIPLYRQIISGHTNTILMGDSAGGGLALGLAQKIVIEKLKPPLKIILLSPWLDISLTNPAIEDINRFDPFLSVKGLRRAGLSYKDNDSENNAFLSPIYGPLKQLGEISIFIGTLDVLVADTRKLKSRADKEGVLINYNEYDKMVHVWMFLNFPEAKHAQKEIIKVIKE